MAFQQLMIDNTLNQKTSVSVEVDGEQLSLDLFLRYNRMAGYWVADISRVDTQELLIASMPLLVGYNLLEQYTYHKIGWCAIVNIGSNSPDSLSSENLGTDFLWIWDDNV
jgi:hypothetical protein